MGCHRFDWRRFRSHSRGATGRPVVIAMFVVGIAMVATMFVMRAHYRRLNAKTQAATQPSTQPTTGPTTKRATTAPTTQPHDYMSLVLSRYPDFPTTQPLIIPLDRLSDSARLVFNDPILLDARGDLWITRPDAPPVDRVIGNVKFEADQVHLTRDRVLFAWMQIDERGKWQPQIIVRRDANTLQIINREGRLEIGTPGRAYEWDRAFVLDGGEMLVVPTDRGVSIIRPRSRPIESFVDLREGAPTPAPSTAPSTQPATEPSVTSSVQILRDVRGILAWIPWENGGTGSRGAARFVDGKWTRLDASTQWPERILHLIPLLDGGVLQLVVNDDDFVVVRLVMLDMKTAVDEKAVAELVEKLSNEDPKTREEAHAKLTQYGAGVWPILEKMRDAQNPEGQIRIDQLLRAKVAPALGKMRLEEGPVRVVSRFPDGGALLFAEAGVTVPDSQHPDEDPAPIAPAWIVLNPGAPIDQAQPQLVDELDPKTSQLTRFLDEWILVHDAEGVKRYLGNHFAPMLRKSERSFRKVVGVDRRRRWLLQHVPDDGQTLIIDPTLPDGTPRLPVWNYPVEGGSVGWTADGWPVVKKGGAWVIDANGTRPLNEAKEKMIERVEPDAPSTAPTTSPATTQSTTQPTTQSATQPTTQPAGEILLRDKDGGAYFGGHDDLSYMSRDGAVIHFTLPPEVVGSGEVHLLEAADRLFLFNEPGRVVRLRRKKNADGEESLSVDAVITKNIPNVDTFARIWLDPAGRIVLAYEGNRLTILFPEGRIPTPIAQRMLEADLRSNDPE